MARGLAIPVRATGRGGARTLAGSEYTRQVVLVGLTPNLSRNPFQAGGGVEVGISEGLVFAINSSAARALARRGIVRFFARLRAEDLAKLAPSSEGLEFDDSGPELLARVRYVELESDREDEVESNLRDAYRAKSGDVGGRVV